MRRCSKLAAECPQKTQKPEKKPKPKQPNPKYPRSKYTMSQIIEHQKMQD